MELILSLAQLFIVNWYKNVFTLHRYNNYMFRLLTNSHHQVVFLATVIHERTSSLGQCAVWYEEGGAGYEISYVFRGPRVSIWGNAVVYTWD